VDFEKDSHESDSNPNPKNRKKDLSLNKSSVMKILVGLHQINAIVRSRGEHAARTINACAAAGLRDRHEC
jgi:hypothetical protein